MNSSKRNMCLKFTKRDIFHGHRPINPIKQVAVSLVLGQYGRMFCNVQTAN